MVEYDGIMFAEVQWFRTPSSGAEGHKQLCDLWDCQGNDVGVKILEEF